MLRWFREICVGFMILLFTGSAFSDSCVRLTSGVNPESVARGGTIRASAALRNCSAEPEKFAIRYVLRGPCGYTYLGAVYLTVEDDEARTATLSYPIPEDACTGKYVVKAKAYYDGTLLAVSSVSLTVQ